MRKIIPILLLFSIFCACDGEKKMRKMEVFEIREMGELSTTEFVFSKVLKIDDQPEWYKFGDRKILISCKAKVKAGIDLSALKKEDIDIRNDEITIHVPAPKITSFNMDPNSIKTEMADVSGLRQKFTQDEKNIILQKGEKSIREALVETGIYNEAEKNVVSFITEFYRQMGFEKVQVVIRRNDEK